MHGYRCVYDDGAFAYMQVPLGVLPNNENTTEGMVEILEQMSGYVPEVQVTQESEETVPFPLAMAGDMLTAARARTAQEVRVTSPGKKALRSLFPFTADWHAKANFMEVRKTWILCLFIRIYVWSI